MTSEANRQAYWQTLRDREFRAIRNIEEAADFNYTPHVRKICYDDAIALAVEYQVKNPEWLLCGSLALMISGYLNSGAVSDIDFATNTFPKQMYTNSTKYRKAELGFNSYYHLEVDEVVDLFVHDRPVISSRRRFQHGLRTQRIEHIFKWKKHFNRDKDKNDLMQIHLPESLFEI